VPLGETPTAGSPDRGGWPSTSGYAVGSVLSGVAAVRRGKAVHLHGAVYAAELVMQLHRGVLGRTELFGTPGLAGRWSESEALGFDPWNAGGGLEATGLLNRLSRRVWGGARRANDQAAAEAAVARRVRV
jgi:hypothetical protein